MTQPRLVIVDDGWGRFGPMTDRRAAFRLRTGVHNNRTRIELRLGVMASDLRVPPAVAEVSRQRETDARVNQPLRRMGAAMFQARDGGSWRTVEAADDGPVLVVNGRWTGLGPPEPGDVLGLAAGHALVTGEGELIAALLDVDTAQGWLDARCEGLPPGLTTRTVEDAPLLGRPWHVLDQLEATLAHDLRGVTTLKPVSAKVHPSAVLDDSGGPIMLGERVTIGALAVLEGPCYVGDDSQVMAHTYLRRLSVVGPGCRVAGEVSASVIHGQSNKSHAGFLGHALVGQWVNLGAGTNVSNLKNTYGDVSLQLSRTGRPEDSHRMFHGPVIGDFVRTAIGTRLLTGSVVGTGAMIALSDFAPKFVERFAFLTDKGSMTTDVDKLLDTARIIVARRSATLSPADEALLRTLAEQ